MQSTTDMTTVLCLFHTTEQAQQALSELKTHEIPTGSISVLTSGGSHEAVLKGLGLPEKDSHLLHQGIHNGGTVIVVSGQESQTNLAETVFSRHYGKKIDEQIISNQPEATGAVSGDAVIPVIEEELTVGKRQVQTGGVRVYSRIVETPVEESITLQQEHAIVERHAVNRPVTEADIQAMRVQSIEVTESEEVAVVNKSARVVEEIQVGKEATERVEHISDTVRSTQVEVDPITTETATTATKLGKR